MRKVLNVGANDRSIPLPPQYDGWKHVFLDIDAAVKPDIVCDARNLESLPSRVFDAVYCSHNLEHYHRHEVPKVLRGFAHVLKKDGFADIRVPNIAEVIRVAAEKNLDIDDVLYFAPMGPITVADVIYGYGKEIERSGNDFFSHKTGFTEKSLLAAVQANGFPFTFAGLAPLQVGVLAFKNKPLAFARTLFNLPAM